MCVFISVHVCTYIHIVQLYMYIHMYCNSTIYPLNPYIFESEKGRLLKTVLEQQALMDTYGPSIYNCKSCLYDLKKKLLEVREVDFHLYFVLL